MTTALKGTPELAMRMPEGVVAINIDPTTGTRDDGGILEYFYHENPPPMVEPDLPPLLDGSENSDESGFTPASPNQAQQLLQPEIVLPPPASNPAEPHKQPQGAQTDSQNTAAKVLNPH